MRRAHLLLIFSITALCAGALFALRAGTLLSAPAQRQVGPAPADLPVTAVEFSGLKGWFIPARAGAPCVVLMHGVRADRRSMLERARLLHREGYATLLFDFQAHGESAGRQITFGYLESGNAAAAVETARSKLGCAKVAAIGQSLGGAAALLGQPLEVEALIVESVYPTIQDAIANRMKMRLGPSGVLFTPLLTLQLRYRMGIDVDSLRPIGMVANFPHPIFVISGSEDLHTPLNEARALFDAAREPKEFWAVAGAGHVDLYKFAPEAYRQRILAFLARYLSSPAP